MNSNEEIAQDVSATRRKFVRGVGILAMFTAIAAAVGFPFSRKKNIIACGPDEKKKTMKMLTQDGRLVEIDASLVTATRKKITDKELQNWVKNKS